MLLHRARIMCDGPVRVGVRGRFGTLPSRSVEEIIQWADRHHVTVEHDDALIVDEPPRMQVVKRRHRGIERGDRHHRDAQGAERRLQRWLEAGGVAEQQDKVAEAALVLTQRRDETQQQTELQRNGATRVGCDGAPSAVALL